MKHRPPLDAALEMDYTGRLQAEGAPCHEALGKSERG